MKNLTQYLSEKFLISNDYVDSETLLDIVNKYVNFKHLFGHDSKYQIDVKMPNGQAYWCKKMIHEITVAINNSCSDNTMLTHQQEGECNELFREMYKMDHIYKFVHGSNGEDIYIDDMYEEIKANDIIFEDILLDDHTQFSISYCDTQDIIIFFVGNKRYGKTYIAINNSIIKK